MIIFLYLILALLAFGVLAYVWWTIQAGWQRQWRKFSVLLGIPVVIAVVLILGFQLSIRSQEQRYNAAAFGTVVMLPPPLFNYRADENWSGEGYSFLVYALPPSIRHEFESDAALLMASYPTKAATYENEQIIHWQRGPFDPSLQKYLNVALGSKGEGLDPQIAAVRAALAKPTTYYAIFYQDIVVPGKTDATKPSTAPAQAVNLLVIDLAGEKLYSISNVP